MEKYKNLQERIKAMLTLNVQLPTSEVKTQALITNYSPNNLKSVILSQEGVLLTFFTTKGTNQNRATRYVPFPQTEASYTEITTGKPLLSFILSERVYSSIEEIVIIRSTGASPLMTLGMKEIDYVINKLVPKLKRLKSFIALNPIQMTLKEFGDYYANQLKDPYKHLYDLEEIQEPQHGRKQLINEDWYLHTQLRPQFYALDTKEGALDTYFKKVKAHFDTTKQEQEQKERIGKKVDKGKQEQELQEAVQIVRNIEKLADVIVLIESDEPPYNPELFTGRGQEVLDSLRSRTKFTPIGVLNQELENLANTEINLFLKSHNYENRELGLDSIKELQDQMFEFILAYLKPFYFEDKGTSEETKPYQKVLSSLFDRKVISAKSNALIKYLLNQPIKSIGKNEVTSIIRLLELQPQKTYNLTGQELVPPKPDRDIYEELNANMGYVDPLELALIQDIWHLEAGFYLTGDTDIQTLAILHDYFVKAAQLDKGFYSATLTKLYSQTGATKARRIGLEEGSILNQFITAFDLWREEVTPQEAPEEPTQEVTPEEEPEEKKEPKPYDEGWGEVLHSYYTDEPLAIEKKYLYWLKAIDEYIPVLDGVLNIFDSELEYDLDVYIKATKRMIEILSDWFGEHTYQGKRLILYGPTFKRVSDIHTVDDLRVKVSRPTFTLYRPNLTPMTLETAYKWPKVMALTLKFLSVSQHGEAKGGQLVDSY